MELELTKDKAAERFMRYAAITTQSKEGCETTPSTPCQRDLALLLYDELTEMGASEVYYDSEHCYVYAAVPGNIPADNDALSKREDAVQKRRTDLAPVIGFMAHMDTSDAVAGLCVKPRLIEEYDGGVITLNDEENIVSDPDVITELKDMKGKTLVVCDGTSVLGGDDKAGIAIIMEIFRFYLSHPEYPHGTIRLVFTPDEEVGNGTLWVDRDRFACDYAYTVDGGSAGGLEYECFNAATCKIDIKGMSTHPGSAKGKMKNALLMAMELNAMLPAAEIPACTEGYEGFYHLTQLDGTCDRAHAEYIIRDHDRDKFEERKKTILEAVKFLGTRYGEDAFDVSIRDSYYNMAEKIRPHMHLIENAKAAIQKAGLTPVIQPIRGGTDGCRLSFEGLPCPNLGTGSYCIHGRHEFVCIDELVKCVEIGIRIVNAYAEYELDA
ncbi:MAG: peptidase T [Lachnospiraceae bacterium]|nr:peptidase T [Lachnospiraceae bacterium]